MIHVISTGLFAKTKDRCLESIFSQMGASFAPHYVEAGEQTPPRTAIENRYDIVRWLDPSDVVVEVDGDDYLADAHVLERVANWYANPDVWVTFGSFRYSDGRPGFAAPYAPHEDVRTTPWRATHLKTFRAGLFQRIRLDDLQQNGQWIDRALDLATMFPILEMAGPEHTRFVPEVLYVYDLAQSFERNCSNAAELMREQKVAAWIRSRPRYERIEAR